MKIATWNVGDGHDAVKTHGLVRLVKAGVDVICLQECGDRDRMLEEFTKRAGWRAWYGEGPGAASVPILWNSRAVEAMRAGTHPATKATRVGDKGAGPSTMKAKVWNRVRFHGDGEAAVVINGHIVPSVYLPPRRRLAHQQIAVLADTVRRHESRGVPVVAVGDFNMKPGDRLTKPLRELGMKQRTKDATHGRRTIDHIWTLGIGGNVEVLKMPSDHNAAILTTKEHR